MVLPGLGGHTAPASLTPGPGEVIIGTAAGPAPITTANPVELLSMPLDDFSDPAAWTATGGATTASVTGDPDHAHGLSITTGAGVTGTITRDLAFDMRRRFVSFWLKRTDANFERLVLGFSVRGRSFFRIIQGTVKREGETVLDRWHRVTVPVSLVASGSPVPAWDDLADIRVVRIEIVPKPGLSSTVELADLRLHDNPLPAGVIWQFDDARLNTYDVAFPLLAQHGFRGSVPVETGNLGNANRMVLSQLQELQAAGWEMNSHTVSGQAMSSSNMTNVRTQLRDSYAWLMDNGFAQGAKHFIYPGGAWDASILAETRRHYRTARTTGAIPGVGYETPFVADRHLLRPYYFTWLGISLATATAAVDQLVARGGFAIFCFHNIDPDAGQTGPESWRVDDFTALVEYAAAQGLADYLPSEVWPG